MTLVAGDVDLKDIGWWLKDLEDKEYGPYRRDALLQFQTQGIVTRDTQVRHNTDMQWVSMAELFGAEIPEGSAHQPSGALPVGKAAGSFSEGRFACIKHRDRRAVTICFRCHGPVCANCQYKPAHRMCRGCHTSLYNRRTVAGLLDYAVPRWIVAAVAVYVGMAMYPNLFQGTMDAKAKVAALTAITQIEILFTLVWIGYIALKEKVVPGGRSLGKVATGLRVVDFETGEPLTTVQCLKRNCLPAFYIVPYANLVAGLWWMIDVSKPWYDTLQRRFFDKWSGTWVVDMPDKLQELRTKTAAQVKL